MAREVGEEEGTIKHITKAYIGVQHIHTSRRDVYIALHGFEAGYRLCRAGWLGNHHSRSFVDPSISWNISHLMSYYFITIMFSYILCVFANAAHTHTGDDGNHSALIYMIICVCVSVLCGDSLADDACA